MGKLYGAAALVALVIGCAAPEAADPGLEVAVTRDALELWPPNWVGDSSECANVPADRVAILNDHEGGEWDVDAPDDPNAGHPGCDGAYIVDYVVTAHPSWDWAWMHAAHYGEECGGTLWHNQKIYRWKQLFEDQEPTVQLADEASWEWTDECNSQFINQVPAVRAGDSVSRIRMVTQFGVGERVGLSQMVYLQTFLNGEDGPI